MSGLENLLEKNKQWAEGIKWRDPKFFERLSNLQSPKYMWIGCSDSRITPAASIGLLPGELFVHRNIANLVIHTDMNCLSVMQFAVEVLKVEHVIVCGHYGCGGVEAAMQNVKLGLIDNWLRHIQDEMRDYENDLEKRTDFAAKMDRLCEINIIEQVLNAGQTTIIQDAWLKNQNVSIHGWIYRLTDGIHQDLQVTIDSLDTLNDLRTRMFALQKNC
ncbi:MAG TPA: carbonate dehydratase [Pyrinomonadaceae bacterium]|jgi:carbonic anhydrase